MNRKRAAVRPNVAAVRAALASRRRSDTGGYANEWDDLAMARVDGAAGPLTTTDELIQWAAVKWGLPDEVLRGQCVRESTWYSTPTYANGFPVYNWGCGDMSNGQDGIDAFGAGIANISGGPDYRILGTYHVGGVARTFDADHVPETFGICGVKSWQAPAWGQMTGNQNGTFPFNRDSISFALDYMAAVHRAIIEGWATYLTDQWPNGITDDAKFLGAVGAWFSGGDWMDGDAQTYLGLVQDEIDAQTWTLGSFAAQLPPSSEEYGAAGVDPY